MRGEGAGAAPGSRGDGAVGHHGCVIVRMWECEVRPGRAEELVEHVLTSVLPSVRLAEGFLGGEVLRSVARESERLLLVTRWESEASLESYLGPRWTAHELTPVPDEAVFIAGVPFVDNWSPVAEIG